MIGWGIWRWVGISAAALILSFGMAALVAQPAMAERGGEHNFAKGVVGDVNSSGTIDAIDVQIVINAVLGLLVQANHTPDINGDGQSNALDVQLVINAALGIPIDISGGTPVANAGPDQNVHSGNAVTLDGTATANAQNFSWSQIEGPFVLVSGMDSAIASFTAGAPDTYQFELTATGVGGATATDVITVIVQDLPWVTFTQPSRTSWISTNAGTVNVNGIVSAFIDSISLRNTVSNDVVDVAFANESFDIDVELEYGDNPLRLTAVDNLGAQAQAEVIVTRNAAPGSLDAPQTNPREIFATTATEVLITVEADDLLAGTAESVALYWTNGDVSDGGAPIPMSDDGAAESGDVLANDGIYSCRMEIDDAEAGDMLFRAAATVDVNGSASIVWSPGGYMNVLPDVSPEDMALVDVVIGEMLDTFRETKQGPMTPEEYYGAIEEMQDWLNANEHVATAELNSNKDAIVTEFTSGLAHILYFVDEDIYGSGEPKFISNGTTPVTKDYGIAIGNQQVSAWFPFYWEHAPNDAGYGLFDSLDSPFTQKRFLTNENATAAGLIEALRDSGVMLIWTHASYISNTHGTFLATGDVQSAERDAYYKNDLCTQRMVKGNIKRFRTKDFLFLEWPSVVEETGYYIGPEFIRHHLNTSHSQAPNSFVWLGGCQTNRDPILSNALLEGGVGAVAGFDGYINKTKMQAYSTVVFERLLAGDTVGEVKNYLEFDPCAEFPYNGTDILSCLEIWGNENLTLLASLIGTWEGTSVRIPGGWPEGTTFIRESFTFSIDGTFVATSTTSFEGNLTTNVFTGTYASGDGEYPRSLSLTFVLINGSSEEGLPWTFPYYMYRTDGNLLYLDFFGNNPPPLVRVPEE